VYTIFVKRGERGREGKALLRARNITFNEFAMNRERILYYNVTSNKSTKMNSVDKKKYVIY